MDGGIVGVVSRSSEASLRIYNGRQRYDEWEFSYNGAAGDDAGGPLPESGREPRGPGDPFGSGTPPRGFGLAGTARPGSER